MDVLIDGIKVAALGISVTFVMLFLIVGFVKILKPILDVCTRSSKDLTKNRDKDTEQTLINNKVVVSEKQNNIQNDEQIVAAIIAAICYDTGMSSDMFVLKSIRRRKTN